MVFFVDSEFPLERITERPVRISCDSSELWYRVLIELRIAIEEEFENLNRRQSAVLKLGKRE